ncbi:transketolase [Ornithobacterium rhinotracheale]|uniref:alpha-ketoacid dehydrogenase subunit alpha/beta n=1 Tax=Ornithobacterium rhinotracheale TaxID=28251 RepID=UPI00129CCFFB|nr:alpha-ketoacid dehydrogenase subunit alpha/beta [Ornithobacterium rhinotracheale]MRJ10754.1 transketolase [Ornithobacterium rhinotracheale]
MQENDNILSQEISFETFKNEILNDYYTARLSREISLLGRKEVLTGKAKFGIFGGGKEVPQIALSKVFKKGDFRSGYYRDQTLMLAIGETTPENIFAQLYATTDEELEPASAGRQMTSHFATHSLNKQGEWNRLSEQKNSVSDISPTAGQMPRLVGLGQASKYYKNVPSADPDKQFSINGREIAFGTIGDASTSEGHFWECINAVGVMQVPVVLSIWDDEYGISVNAEFQRTKSNLSEMLEGFRKTANERGIEIITTSATDYAHMLESYQKAEKIAREEYTPVVVHVRNCTQPQGHSTSGSHERYKSPERLQWEKENDNIEKLKQFILSFEGEQNGTTLKIATEEEIQELDKKAKTDARQAQKKAWADHTAIIQKLKDEAVALIEQNIAQSSNATFLKKELDDLNNQLSTYKRSVFYTVRKALRLTAKENYPARKALSQWYQKAMAEEYEHYSTRLYFEDFKDLPKAVKPTYNENPEEVDGRIVLRDNFEKIFEKNPKVLAFGEDSGKIGDVNQGLEGLQEKFGIDRVSDTGIREATILGQGIGLAMRGLRPIAEIQYLDYVLYCLQGMSDDLATLCYRSNARQVAPVIVRTRGHRLEGIWHAGSPMGGILNLIKGMYFLVPRNLTQAAGFYNSLMEVKTPAFVVESLNGYRLKEPMPNNLGEFKTPIGEVEITKEGKDVTILTYGSTWRIVTEAAKELTALGIDAEVIDVQSLIPFDISKQVNESLAKTNRLVVVDEDVPGGASAYILQQVLEQNNGYYQLDSKPLTITSKEHRPAYATDGDYFSKPSLDDVVEGVYQLMSEAKPDEYPPIFKK